ncbi:hypothetical protein EVAR_40238_1 [Eumeta japonica]|uniref:Uncharacterized protein n=1 Tax=Eumeta variegata TaxID=151549 RepID=A0A4C1XBQ3_EUMVA|nr:hypothetical protein EVAR_40238_1 [Eumeta japonica]
MMILLVKCEWTVLQSEELDFTKSIPELDAAPDTSVYPDPEQPQQGTSKNQSEPYFSVNNIASSPYVTDKGNFKELTDQLKRRRIVNRVGYSQIRHLKIQNVWMEGYDDWKHIVDAIERHETSKIHLDSCFINSGGYKKKNLSGAKYFLDYLKLL